MSKHQDRRIESFHKVFECVRPREFADIDGAREAPYAAFEDW